MLITELATSSRRFLDDFMAANPLPNGDEGLAIFSSFGGRYQWIEGARVPSNRGGVFREEAPDGLYRAGACGKIVAPQGLLVVSDERKKYFKPLPSGYAKYSEGRNLIETWLRELGEEAFVFELKPKHEHRRRLVPPVYTSSLSWSLTCEGLAMRVGGIRLEGQFTSLGIAFNEVERCVEYHARWDLSELALADSLSVFYDEDEWYAGGRPGIPVVALDHSGNVAGWFAGQQGFVPAKGWNLHPAVRKFLDLPA